MKIILLVIAVFAFSASCRAEDGASLSAAFGREVDRRLDVPAADQARYAQLLESALNSAEIPLIRSQYLVMVDSNPHVQAIFVYWLDAQAPPDFLSSSERFRFIGASPVSSGKPGRYDYFTTPLGVFAHTLENKDFRAEGTLNKLGIRGLGIKGMRVFDFGWVEAERRLGWRKNKSDAFAGPCDRPRLSRATSGHGDVERMHTHTRDAEYLHRPLWNSGCRLRAGAGERRKAVDASS
jgi:hypothetical protein